MELINESRFTAAWITGKIRFPADSLTVVVKAAFDLVPGTVTLAEEQLLPTGDEERPEGLLRYSNDFALFKPKTDLLLVGSCHAPGGTPVRMCPVSFGVGRWSKTLLVLGDRLWRKRFLGGKISEPEPFTTMPLTWDRAFGGPKYPKNPLGVGTQDVVDADGTVTVCRMPNVESPDLLIVSPKNKPDPAGFGPIPLAWPQRMSKVGTYGKKWGSPRKLGILRLTA